MTGKETRPPGGPKAKGRRPFLSSLSRHRRSRPRVRDLPSPQTKLRLSSQSRRRRCRRLESLEVRASRGARRPSRRSRLSLKDATLWGRAEGRWAKFRRKFRNRPSSNRIGAACWTPKRKRRLRPWSRKRCILRWQKSSLCFKASSHSPPSRLRWRRTCALDVGASRPGQNTDTRQSLEEVSLPPWFSQAHSQSARGTARGGWPASRTGGGERPVSLCV